MCKLHYSQKNFTVLQATASDSRGKLSRSDEKPRKPQSFSTSKVLPHTVCWNSTRFNGIPKHIYAKRMLATWQVHMHAYYTHCYTMYIAIASCYNNCTHIALSIAIIVVPHNSHITIYMHCNFQMIKLTKILYCL